ncbi:hypothetical protein B0H13DRAFT_1876417 [Mycena leptocephala]|nr:hypothetical protein B0H13DRAFT_1876417 [Mycena leptocephala]
MKVNDLVTAALVLDRGVSIDAGYGCGWKSANAKAEVSVLLNGTWMCGGPSEPHSANLLYLAMGLRLPRSEYSPGPPPEERRKEMMTMLLVYRMRKGVTMEIVEGYLKILAEATDGEQIQRGRDHDCRRDDKRANMGMKLKQGSDSSEGFFFHLERTMCIEGIHADGRHLDKSNAGFELSKDRLFGGRSNSVKLSSGKNNEHHLLFQRLCSQRGLEDQIVDEVLPVSPWEGIEHP